MRRSLRIAVVAVVCVLVGTAARAQAPLPVADAARFIGTWTLTLESPQGPLEMNLALTDNAGSTAAELSSGMMGTQKVADISKAGNDLVLKYQGDFQGQAFAAKITLTPAEEKLVVIFDIMDGQFMMSGAATKK